MSTEKGIPLTAEAESAGTHDLAKAREHFFNKRWARIGAAALTGCALATSAFMLARSQEDFATDRCSSMLHWQVDTSTGFETLARNLNGNKIPNNYVELAEEVKKIIGTEITAEDILVANSKEAANKDSRFPTTVDQPFSAPAVYCFNLPAPKNKALPSNIKDDPMLDGVTLVNSPEQQGGVRQLTIIMKGAMDPALIESIQGSGYGVYELDGGWLVLDPNTVLLIRQKIIDALVDKPGIEDPNEAAQRVEDDIVKLGY